MAIEVIVAVLNARKAPWKGGDLAVLLAMANYAHPNGTNIFPSIDRLRRACRLSERSVQGSISALLQDTVLRRVFRASGRPGEFDVYEIDMARLALFEGCSICGGVKCDEAGCPEPPTGVQNLRGKGCNPQRQRVQSATETGAKRSAPYRKTRHRPVIETGAGSPRAPERRGDPALWQAMTAGGLEVEALVKLEAFQAEPHLAGDDVVLDFPKGFAERYVLPYRRSVAGALGRPVVFRFAGRVAQ